MANKLQKLLFNLSTMAPVIFMLTIVYWIEKDIPSIFNGETNKIQLSAQSITLLTVLIGSVLFSLYGFYFVKISKIKLESVPIAIENITPNDNWGWCVVITYIMPLASFAFEDVNIYICIFVALVVICLLAFSNSILPNPLLLIGGYHFYKITNINGCGDVSMISRRNSIHNKKLIKHVIIPFDYLVIEEGE